ncbi:MAG: DUF4830 domain-containing protein [Clostridia bacterium]|nr:DUF4830 domain-containing protein [Clostridia bacterium]
MRNLFLYVIVVMIIATIGTVFYLFADESVNKANHEFLAKFGVEVQKRPIEVEEINIPLPFDNVYTEYNKLQIKAGLDLLPYEGRRAIRYTYEVLNFPYAVDDTVYANVICVDNEPVGGDIMTVSINGFMEDLGYIKRIKK